MTSTYSLEELSDRMEIDQMYARYIHVGDAGDIGELDKIFMPETILDYSSAGYDSQTWAAARVSDLFKGNFFSYMFHFSGCVLLDFNEDRTEAYAKSKMINPSGFRDKETGEVKLFQVHGGYDDVLVNTESGWRFKERVWVHNWASGGFKSYAGMMEMLEDKPE